MEFLLAFAVALGLAVFCIGRSADWHMAAALGAAAVPALFTYFAGVIGLVASGLFVAAVWKAANA